MDDYGDLLRSRLDLAQFRGYLTTEETKHQATAQGRYDALRNRLVYALLRERSEVEGAVALMRERMAAERPGTPDDLLSLMDEVEDDLAQCLDRQGRRRPWQRTLVHRAPLIIAVVAIVLYLGLRSYSHVPVDAPAESAKGIKQRAVAAQKAIRYAEWTEVRRNRLVVEVLAWPIQPTDDEQRAAGEFAGLVLGAREALAKAGAVCGVPPSTDEITDADVDLIGTVAATLRSPDLRWASPPVMTVIDPIRKAYPCRPSAPS